MICCLTALSRGTLRTPDSSGREGCTQQVLRLPRLPGLATGADVSVGGFANDRSSIAAGAVPAASARVVDDPSYVGHVLPHLLDQLVDAVELDHAAEPLGELHAHVLAIEVEVLVEHVG